MVDRRRWRCYAYCLMTTHFHLVLETPRANVSEGMQYLNGVYAQGFNKHYGRFGHVLHGRFSAVLIESERQFFETVRYVVLNPVRAGICERAEDWPWSSHRATAGLAPIPPFLTVDRLVSRLAPDPADGIHAYRAFIAEATPSTAGAREGGTDS